MKRRIFAVPFLTLLLCGLARAAYIYQPVPPELWNLPHSQYYGWQIDGSESILPNPDDITGATLEIFQLYNYSAVDTNNKLSINLMSKGNIQGEWTFVPGNHVYIGSDSISSVVNDLPGVEITSYTDDDGPATKIHFVYNFDSTELALLKNHISNDTLFGIGLDPDCHFLNNGIKLTLSVPAPSALLLVGIGIGLVGWLHRRITL